MKIDKYYALYYNIISRDVYAHKIKKEKNVCDFRKIWLDISVTFNEAMGMRALKWIKRALS